MARRSLLIAGAVAAAGFALLVGLGTWQLERLAWKEALIVRIAERMAAAPTEVPSRNAWSGLDLGSLEYRRVSATGVFDHAKEVRAFVNLSQPNGRLKGPGYFILTPLRLRDGGEVIVNRGFVPEPLMETGALAGTRPEGETTVVGLLREPEGRNMFTPPDDPGKRLFFARDPNAIAAGLGLVDAAPFTIDADAEPETRPLPQGGETRIAFPNRHLEYALTWYGLAATLAAVFAAFALRRQR